VPLSGLVSVSESDDFRRVFETANQLDCRADCCEGRKPYGFYPGEKGVVERMRALRAEPLGFDRLAAKLNAEGFRTRKGTPWHGFAVNRILSRQRVRARAR